MYKVLQYHSNFIAYQIKNLFKINLKALQKNLKTALMISHLILLFLITFIEMLMDREDWKQIPHCPEVRKKRIPLMHMV